MTYPSAINLISGLLQFAVAGYTLWLTRRFGVARPGWPIFSAFAILASLHWLLSADLLQPTGEQGLVLDEIYAFISLLLLAGMTQLGTLLRGNQRRARELCREMEERVRAEGALRASEERFTKAFESSPMPMAIQSWPDGKFLAVNSRFHELAGYLPGQILQRCAEDLKLWEDEAALNARLQPGGRVRDFSCVLRRSDGTPRNVVLGAERLEADAQPCLLLVAEDVTERLKLEAGLRQTQKLEVVGRMVASIAHEFNNVLTVIQGHASLLCLLQDGNQRSLECADRILQASQRAARFTRQLLGICRQQPVHFGPVDLSTSIQSVQELLQQSLAKRYELKPVLADDLPPLRADEFNLEQILINLILNARDAMPDGEDIVVGACPVELTAAQAEPRRADGAKAGAFVCLAVSDRGCGIPHEIADHIFEPFFTTKEVGKGTGLGLWLVRNTVQQHGGWIELASEVGRGSTFKIFLPVWDGPVPAEMEADAANMRPTAQATEAGPAKFAPEEARAFSVHRTRRRNRQSALPSGAVAVP